MHLQGNTHATGSENKLLNNSIFGAFAQDKSHLLLHTSTLGGNSTANLYLTHCAVAKLDRVLLHDSKTGIALDCLSHGTFEGSDIHSCSTIFTRVASILLYKMDAVYIAE